MRAVAIALIIAFLSLVATAQQTPFGTEVHVTAIDVMAEVVDREGKTPRDLKPEDFVIIEDGAERSVTAIEYLADVAIGQPLPLPGVATPNPLLAQKKWNVVVYVDLEMSSYATMREALKSLAKEAGRLTQLGTIEIVVADPSPRRILAPSADPAAIRTALAAAERMPARDRFTRIRREFIARMQTVVLKRDKPNYAEVGDIRVPIQEERHLIQQFNDRLSRFLAGYSRNTTNAMLLISDGYDVDPVAFYGPTLEGGPLVMNRIRGELGDKNARIADDLARHAAAAGWTIVTLSGGMNMPLVDDATSGTGHRRTNFHANESAQVGSTDLISLNPRDPLNGLAEATGGSVHMHPAQYAKAIEALGNRVRFTYQVSRPADSRVRTIQIKPRRSDLRVKTARWVTSSTPEMVAALRATTLLDNEAADGELPVAASLDFQDDDGNRGVRIGALDVRMALHPIESLRKQLTNASIRVTVAVEVPRERPLVIHQVLSDHDLSIKDVLTFTAPFQVLDKTRKVAVVIEELTSGAWGGATITLQPGAPAARQSRR